MATLQCQKEKTGTSCSTEQPWQQKLLQTVPTSFQRQWGKVFPNEQVTEQQSALFVKKLLAVAISNITYLRAIFPERAFGDRALEDLNLKILRDESTCPSACQVINWVKGCFDALDKKYLRMLVIGLYDNKEDNEKTIETYTFKFSYAENGGIDIYRNKRKISGAYTAAETKKATIRLLRTIVVLTHSLPSLPDDIMMTMKLFYYDEVTPADYEPPGFQPCDSDSFQFNEEPMNIKVGDVATPFHTLKLRIKVDGKNFEVAQTMEDETVEAEGQEISNDGLDQEEVRDIQESSNGDENECNEDSGIEKAAMSPLDLQVVPEPMYADSVPDQTPTKPDINGQAAVETASTQASEASQSGNEVRCGCGSTEDDGLMILCENCKFWQHGVCYMVLEEDEAPSSHICEVCGDVNDPSLQPTDPQLVGINEIACQALCLWRRALAACTDTNRMLPQHLAKRLDVEMTVAQGLLNRLEKEGIVKPAAKGKRLGKIVSKASLKEGISKYFTKKSNDLQYAGSEIEKITSQAQSLKLTETMDTTEDINITDKNTIDKAKTSADRKLEKGRKRVKSSSGEEFELCNSQFSQENSEGLTESDTGAMTRRKRRKASIVSSTLQV